jgi:hypothetical protein
VKILAKGGKLERRFVSSFLGGFVSRLFIQKRKVYIPVYHNIYYDRWGVDSVDAKEAEKLYKLLVSEADVLYQYAISHKCEDARRVGERLLAHPLFKDPYSDDLRFYTRMLMDHACYDIGDPDLIHKWFRRAIPATIAKKFDVVLKY